MLFIAQTSTQEEFRQMFQFKKGFWAWDNKHSEKSNSVDNAQG